MILSEETKNKIIEEYNEWNKDSLISKKDKMSKRRYSLFFTPPQITIKMLEKLEDLSGNVLDPCMGDGNLLVAAIIAGADPDLVYGNEFDEEMLQEAKRRLVPLGVPEWHLHRGDALLSSSYDFSEDYVPEQSKYKGVQASGVNKMVEVYKKEGK